MLNKLCKFSCKLARRQNKRSMTPLKDSEVKRQKQNEENKVEPNIDNNKPNSEADKINAEINKNNDDQSEAKDGQCPTKSTVTQASPTSNSTSAVQKTNDTTSNVNEVPKKDEKKVENPKNFVKLKVTKSQGTQVDNEDRLSTLRVVGPMDNEENLWSRRLERLMLTNMEMRELIGELNDWMVQSPGSIDEMKMFRGLMAESIAQTNVLYNFSGYAKEWANAQLQKAIAEPPSLSNTDPTLRRHFESIPDVLMDESQPSTSNTPTPQSSASNTQTARQQGRQAQNQPQANEEYNEYVTCILCEQVGHFAATCQQFPKYQERADRMRAKNRCQFCGMVKVKGVEHVHRK